MKDYNFLYIKKNGTTKSIGFTGKTYRLLHYAAVFVLVIVISSLLLNFVLFKQFSANRKLAGKNKNLLKNMTGIEVQISSLYDALSELAQRDQNIKIMLSDAMGYNREFSSIGGGNTEDLFDLLTANKRENFEMINRMLNNIHTRAEIEKQNQAFIENVLNTKTKLLAATPSVIPLDGWITSGFGPRRDPFTGRPEFHKGLDIASWLNSPVKAPAAGSVVYVGKSNSYGNVLIINHGYGISTVYAHLNKILVHINQKIKRYDIVALVGSTGRSTGPHLHYEVRENGMPVNPMKYIY